MSQSTRRESHTRSILKAITWRFIATGTTFLLAYTIFSQTECEGVLEKSTLVAGLELVLKLLFYYLHERAWQKVPRGRIREIFKVKSEK